MKRFLSKPVPTMTSYTRHIFKTDEVIMQQGDDGDCAFIIESGTVQILIDRGNGVLQAMGARGKGSIVGEMALIDGKPRTATIKATSECQLLRITREDFERRILNSDPTVQLMMQIVLARYREVLRQANTSINKNDNDAAEKVELEHSSRNATISTFKMANNFSHAISNNELELYYQPMIDLRANKICGFEALMRWKNSQGDLIATPDVFIPLAEETGLITKASIWAFETACSALKKINQMTPAPSNLFMSVNFSSEDFTSQNLPEKLTSILSRTGVKPQDIHLEITERVLITQQDQAKSTIEACRKNGMVISIDDFGTGYSSLSYLHDYPVDILKIDRSFVINMTRDKKSWALIKSIISLGHNLNMKIIAEGVETENDYAELKALGCDLAQGYFFSKPINFSDLVDFVKNNPNLL